MVKRALITGVGGQDGSYLAEFLIEKGYEVYGVERGSDIEDYPNLWDIKDKIELIQGDVTDSVSLINAISISQPDEIYNLAGQSSVAESWKQPNLTMEINALGVFNVLEAVKLKKPDAKVYQASSSEMFGGSHSEGIQDENVPFYPKSPYAVSKAAAHWAAINYRESYNMFICCGILFNHESPRRPKKFVTRKITDGVARIKLGLANELVLGNLDAKRDWGYAKDYVEAMWMMLQQEKPDDYIIATGETHSVEDFVRFAFEAVGITDWRKYVKQDPKFMRPVDVSNVRANPLKTFEKLGWKPKVNFKELLKLMVENDMEKLGKGHQQTPS